MRKILIALTLLVSLFLLVSCGSNSGTSTTVKGAYLGGTQGIEGTFEDFGVLENGVSSVFDSEDFPIEITLRNKGEYAVKAGEVVLHLLGPAKDEFSGISSWDLSNKGEIEIISDLLPQGGEESVSFATSAKYTKPVNGILDRSWFASIESKYQTYLIIPEVCLKEDLTDTRICEVKGSKTFSVSGAPIIVTGVEEETAGQGIMALRIKISNVGGGDVTKSSEAFDSNYQKLTYTVDDATWECKSGGKIGEARLVDKAAELLCKTKEPLAKDTLSTKQLRLTFDYKYRNLIDKKISLKQSVK